MTDFTKEELEEIKYCLHFVHGDCSFEEKLQSMIDSYDAEVVAVWHCEKCGHVQ